MVMDMLHPYETTITSSPIFRHEWRRLRWLNNESALKRYNRIVLIGLPLIALIGWAIQRRYLTPGAVRTGFEDALIYVLIVISLVVMFMSSLYSLPAVIGTLHTQRTSAYWDTLRLTPQYNGTILMSQDAIARLRLWPLTAAEIGLRLTAVVLLIANHYDRLNLDYQDISSFIFQTIISPIILGVGAIVVLFAVAFSIEPIIRTRLIVALNIAIASRISNITLALLTGFFTISIIHLSQILLLGGAWGFMQSLAKQPAQLVSIICLAPLTLSAFIIVWLIYRFARNAALSTAYEHAFRQD